MLNRHRAREIALQILYRYDVALGSTPKVEPPKGGALATELSQHFDHFIVSQDLRDFAAHLVAGTLQNQTELDGLLERHASNWKVARMSSVDRSLLRMAAYELKSMPETPSSVVIDEAIELAKQFGTSDTPAFVNGVLDAVKGELRPAQASS
jgi:transcription antitermination protein NusB